MKITAFAGSSSAQSINRALVRFALGYFPNAEINFLDLNDFEMPIFSVDKEKLGFPEQAHQFLQAIGECDVLICSMAEHNRSYSVAFKNIFDWASRVNPKVFQGKKMLLMSTSPGGYGGGNVMAAAKSAFPQFAAEVVETFSLPKFYDNFDLEKGITNADMLAELEQKIENFKQQIG